MTTDAELGPPRTNIARYEVPPESTVRIGHAASPRVRHGHVFRPKA